MRTCCWVFMFLLSSCLGSADVLADAFGNYILDGSIELPVGAGPFDTMADGRVVTIVAADIMIEDAAGVGTFGLLGALPNADISGFGASFLRVSPNGGQLAVGNNGGASGVDFEVGVFDVATLTGRWLLAASFDATWLDEVSLALSAGDFSTGVVTMLDTTSADAANPINPTVISNIGGASGGVAFDGLGNLYTGNGFMGAGPSGTGTVKAFSMSDWTSALNTNTPINFEMSGLDIVDVLSASSLGFDAEGNLHVAGGDFNLPKVDFVALVRASAVALALAGMGPADINDPSQVRRLDPDNVDNFNFYSVIYSVSSRRLHLRSSGSTTAFFYVDPTQAVPTLSAWGFIVMCLCMLTVATLVILRRKYAMYSLSLG